MSKKLYRKTTKNNKSKLDELAAFNSDCTFSDNAVLGYDASDESIKPLTSMDNFEINNLTVHCNTILEGPVTVCCCITFPAATITNLSTTNITNSCTITTENIDVCNCVNVACDVNIGGNLYVCGTEYITDIEQVQSCCDRILLRDGAISGLAAGCLSGIEVNKYDGTNNTCIGVDNCGTLRIGDAGTCLEPVLTRNESGNLSDKALLQWDADYKRADTINMPTTDKTVLTARVLAGNLDHYEWSDSIAKADCVCTNATIVSADRRLILGEAAESATTYGKIYVSRNCNATFNPATGVLSATCFCGNATSATTACYLSLCGDTSAGIYAEAGHKDEFNIYSPTNSIWFNYRGGTNTIKVGDGSGNGSLGTMCVNGLCVGTGGIKTHFDLNGYCDEDPETLTWYMYCDGSACFKECVETYYLHACEMCVCRGDTDYQVIDTGNIGNYLICQCRVSLEQYLACTSLCSNVLYLVY